MEKKDGLFTRIKAMKRHNPEAKAEGDQRMELARLSLDLPIKL